MTASEKVRDFYNDRWRLTPARMAEHLTGGRFKRFAHIRFLERKIAEALARGRTRLLITMPPCHGKSWLASLFTPAWYLSLWPERTVVLATHDSKVAWSRGREVREVLRRHGRQLQVGLSTNGSATPDWRTSRGGGLSTVGIGGVMPARAGHLMIVDDPLRSWKAATSDANRLAQLDWFKTAFRTHAEADASFIVIMTRWHERDLAGQLAGEGGWDDLRLPAEAEAGDLLGRAAGEPLCSERFDREALARLRSEVGTSAWNALYQQRPEGPAGTILKRSWWKHYSVLPTRFDEVLQSWDLAFKDGAACDYVVGQVWGRLDDRLYLIDQVRSRMDFLTTTETVRSLSHRYPRAGRKLVEEKANGSALLSALRESVPGLVAVTPDASKEARAQTIAPLIEAGRVFLPDARVAPWVSEFITECSEFPNGSHDDQVDAMTYALNALKKGG